MLLLPRISISEVDLLLDEYRGLSVNELAARTEQLRPWLKSRPTSPTGGYPVDSAVLETWRRGILSIAYEWGYPIDSGRDKQRGEFDRKVTKFLWQQLSEVAPGDLMRGETWAFLTTELLPDVTLWRFPGQGSDRGLPVRRRFIGGQRNAFQRLWTRALLLRQDTAAEPYHLIDSMSEDELVGLIERPNVSASPELAQAIARTLVGFSSDISDAGVKREEVHRGAMLRIRARFPVIAIDFLEGEELQAELDRAYWNALEAEKAKHS